MVSRAGFVCFGVDVTMLRWMFILRCDYDGSMVISTAQEFLE
ncbi:Protein of unknown function [Pyronema omphalodes CBS 100304]|uniref:Uncharacterized protein n=1 Tax=Pyronema omphalodes (strain CBS 100304) TaxID=1076935 RepID=U4L3S3_PYROM|nr:Protein of unknown function [Pyronema omphalodes CBS 100304]